MNEDRERACEGGRVLEDGDFAECLHCERRVRWDVKDDRFWGFQNCEERRSVQEIVATRSPTPRESERPMSKTMDELFARAEAEGLWFHCAYQDLWFSPKSLRAQQALGLFRWGAVNWELRDPQEMVDAAARRVAKAVDEHERVKSQVYRA